MRNSSWSRRLSVTSIDKPPTKRLPLASWMGNLMTRNDRRIPSVSRTSMVRTGLFEASTATSIARIRLPSPGPNNSSSVLPRKLAMVGTASLAARLSNMCRPSSSFTQTQAGRFSRKDSRTSPLFRSCSHFCRASSSVRVASVARSFSCTSLADVSRVTMLNPISVPASSRSRLTSDSTASRRPSLKMCNKFPVHVPLFRIAFKTDWSSSPLKYSQA